MRKIIIFQILILFIGTLFTAPVFAVERVDNNGEKMGIQQNDPVKLTPNITKEENKDPYVYITKHGKKYHRKSCSYLSESKIKIRLSEAKRRGYKPCSKCRSQER